MTLSFEAKGAATQITLRHAKFASDESRDSHEKGWRAILGCLDAALA